MKPSKGFFIFAIALTAAAVATGSAGALPLMLEPTATSAPIVGLNLFSAVGSGHDATRPPRDRRIDRAEDPNGNFAMRVSANLDPVVDGSPRTALSVRTPLANPVPEPATLWLIGGGIFGAAALRRRRRLGREGSGDSTTRSIR